MISNIKVNNMVSKKIKAVILGSLSACILLVFTGCGGDKTGGGELDFSEAHFVATEDSTGSLSLSVNSQTILTGIDIGDGSRYLATLGDASGGPVATARVRCTGEAGLTTDLEGGAAITDSYGSVSGTVYCLAPGSYQFWCQHLGTTRRVVTSIKCVGDPVVDEDDEDAEADADDIF